MRVYSDDQYIRQSIFDDMPFEDLFGRPIDRNQTWGNWDSNPGERNEAGSEESLRGRSDGRTLTRSAGRSPGRSPGRSSGLPGERSKGRSGDRKSGGRGLSGGRTGGLRGER